MPVPAPAGLSFSERLRARRALWWGTPFRPRQWRSYPAAVHRLRRRHTFLSRIQTDPAAWRCCTHWPHTLLNKWNGREFAARFGCRLPELYWRGHVPSIASLAARPHFVIRPVWGAHRNGVFVVAGGQDLLRRQPVPPPELHRTLRRSLPRRWPAPLLLEEFVRTEDGRYELPVEYKVHTFGRHAAAVQVVLRTSVYADGARQRMYTPAWEPFDDPMCVADPPAPITPPPAALDEMLALAERMGREIGTYMRIDFFSTDGGCVFNEFSSTPYAGEGWTPTCDAVFAALWDEHCPGLT